MALGSQQQRQVRGAYVSTRRRKQRRRWRLLALLAVLILGSAMWVYLGSGEEGGPAAGTERNAVANDARPDALGDQSPDEGPLGRPANPVPVSEPETDDRPLAQDAERPGAAEPAEDSDIDRATTSVLEPTDPAAPAAGAGEDTGSSTTPAAIRSDPQAARLVREGRRLIQRGELVEGRERLNEALQRELSGSDARAVRREIADVNQTLIFSPEVIPSDPYTSVYVVQPGDSLGRIAPRYNTTHRLLARINRIDDPSRIQVGRRLKVIQGPFHAVVDKDSFRLDVYLDPPHDAGAGGAGGPAEDAPIRSGMYVRSFDVGLGEYGSTPLGPFVVKEQSKLVNPEWTNPRTHERVLADDPKNPLGERWIGLRGVGAETRSLKSYGIHGTIEPETIGTDASMGCVRLRPDEIDLLYAMLVEGRSRVRIVP